MLLLSQMWFAFHYWCQKFSSSLHTYHAFSLLICNTCNKLINRTRHSCLLLVGLMDLWMISPTPNEAIHSWDPSTYICNDRITALKRALTFQMESRRRNLNDEESLIQMPFQGQMHIHHLTVTCDLWPVTRQLYWSIIIVVSRSSQEVVCYKNNQRAHLR